MRHNQSRIDSTCVIGDLAILRLFCNCSVGLGCGPSGALCLCLACTEVCMICQASRTFATLFGSTGHEQLVKQPAIGLQRYCAAAMPVPMPAQSVPLTRLHLSPQHPSAHWASAHVADRHCGQGHDTYSR